MATQEEIQELKGEIRTKGVYIEELKTQWKETKDKDEKKYFGDQIFAETGLLTAKQNTLTALITSQQGKFHHIFPLPFPNLLDVILCPISFDISSNPIQVLRLLKVRGDGLCRDEDVFVDAVLFCFVFSMPANCTSTSSI